MLTRSDDLRLNISQNRKITDLTELVAEFEDNGEHFVPAGLKVITPKRIEIMNKECELKKARTLK